MGTNLLWVSTCDLAQPGERPTQACLSMVPKGYLCVSMSTADKRRKKKQMTRSFYPSAKIKRSHATEWLKFRQKLWNLANPSLYGPTYSYVSRWSNIKSFTISAADWRRLLYIQLENGSECCLLEDVLEHTKNLSHKHGQTRLGTTLLRFPLVSRLFRARAVSMSEPSLVKFADGKNLLGKSTCLKICGNLRRVSFHLDTIRAQLLPSAMVL